MVDKDSSTWKDVLAFIHCEQEKAVAELIISDNEQARGAYSVLERLKKLAEEKEDIVIQEESYFD